MTSVRAMLFDLDGTLLDSAPDLVRSLNHVRESEGLAPLPIGDLRAYASKGAIGLLRAGMPPAGNDILETWRQRFLAHYARNSCVESRLFDGIPELLDLLAARAIPWAIVTNKFESLTRPIVDALGLAQAVASVVCGDTLTHKKPHPAPVLLACRQLHVEPGDALMVGDDVRDVEAGEAAGTQTAAVLYGYGSHELVGPVVANSIAVRTPSDLARLVE